MRKTQLLDAFRNIKKQLVSWLSIIVISSFAVAAYLGLTYTAYALSKAASSLYTTTNFRDIQVTSNCMLSADDIDAIRSIPGITDVEGIYRINAKISADSNTKNIYVTSVPQRIGVPILKSGHLPSDKTECIMEENILNKLSLSIGDTITLTDNYDSDIPELSLNEFVITGVFIHAEHATFDMDETYCILVTPEAFDMEKLDSCYTLAEVTFEHNNYDTVFVPAYFDIANDYVDKLEDLGKQRAQTRYSDHLSFLKDQIEDSEKELEDAEGELRLAEKMVSSLNGKTGSVMADLSNMLSVIISEEPSEYKTADEQITSYEDAKKDYDNAIKRVADTRKQYNKLISKGTCDWYVFNRNSSLDFTYAKNNTENLHSLNTSFSSLFVIIAIMVIFASLSRMVYEQRSQIGVSKALGMYSGEVFAKYLIFGLSSSVIGIILGILLSYYIIEWVIALGYADHFVFGMFPNAVSTVPTIVTIVLALLIAFTAIYMSCSQLLKETAKKLLSPRVQKSQLINLEKSPFMKRLSLYNRMIILNMKADIVRIIVTIISVSGCCALIVIGFSLRSSIMGALNNQVEKYMLYDGKIKLNSNLYPDAEGEIRTILTEKGIPSISIFNTHGSIQVDDTMEYTEFLITDDLDRLKLFRPLPSGIDVAALKNGLIITNKLAETYSLKVGDAVALTDDMGYKHSVIVSGIMKNHIGRFCVISKSYYEDVLDDSFSDNAFLLKLPDAALKENPDPLISTLSEIEGFEAYESSRDIVKTFENLLVVLNLIIGLLVILAGVMAMFVLLNLANMYLLSKKTELTIMRINGFTEKETITFCIREVFFTTIIGIILGIIFGTVMVSYILRQMEQVHLSFIHSPNIPSCIMGAVITTIYIIAIYGRAMRRIGGLNLRDIS